MKSALCLSAICLMLPIAIGTQSMVYAQNYTSGDVLQVVASSGLRLRTSPGSQSGTIRILESGEVVTVQNTFNFDSTYRDRSGWLDGNWIYVRHDDVEGYVFDAYLSKLSIPTHENELCLDAPTFSAPVNNYLVHHFPVVSEEQGKEHNESVDQCTYYHEGGIILTQTLGNGWMKSDITFKGYRLSEVMNLFRSMLVGDDMRERFDSSLIFYKDKSHKVYRVQSEMAGCILRIEDRGEGLIQVSLTDLTKVDRC